MWIIKAVQFSLVWNFAEIILHVMWENIIVLAADIVRRRFTADGRSLLLSAHRSQVRVVLRQDRYLQLNPSVFRHHHQVAALHQCSYSARTTAHHSQTNSAQYSSTTWTCNRPTSQFRPFTGTTDLNHSVTWTGVFLGGGGLQSGDVKT